MSTEQHRFKTDRLNNKDNIHMQLKCVIHKHWICQQEREDDLTAKDSSQPYLCSTPAKLQHPIQRNRMHSNFLQESGPYCRSLDTQVSEWGSFKYLILSSSICYRTITLSNTITVWHNHPNGSPGTHPSKQHSAQGHPFVTEALIPNHNPVCNAG